MQEDAPGLSDRPSTASGGVASGAAGLVMGRFGNQRGALPAGRNEPAECGSCADGIGACRSVFCCDVRGWDGSSSDGTRRSEIGQPPPEQVGLGRIALTGKTAPMYCRKKCRIFPQKIQNFPQKIRGDFQNRKNANRKCYGSGFFEDFCKTWGSFPRSLGGFWRQVALKTPLHRNGKPRSKTG